MIAPVFVIIVCVVFTLAAVALALSTVCLFRGGALYLGTPESVVRAMVRMAGIQPGEKVYDLGCGDARLLIAAQQECQAVGIGIDISASLLAIAWLRSRFCRSPVKLIQGNILDIDFNDADVVFCYLMPELLAKVNEKLRKLKPGTRIISHQFGLVGWQPIWEMVVAAPPYEKKISAYRVGLPLIPTAMSILTENHAANRVRWHDNKYSSFY